MNTLRPSLLLLALLQLQHLTPAASAQQTPQPQARPVYVLLQYMRTEPGKAGDYLRAEREVWKPIHQELIRSRRLVSWTLYDVPFTAEVDRDYDYVIASVFDNLEAVGQDPGIEEAFRRAHPGKDPAAVLPQTLATRRVVRSEVWRLLDQAAAARPAGTPSKYALLELMRSKPGGNYVAVEQEIWKRIHQERIKDGHITGWSLYSLVLPGGRDYPYNFGTVNFMDSLATMATPLSPDLLRRAHPDREPAEVGTRTGAARDLVRRELWTLVDFAR